ncbi:28567_t:CDS:1, partial [Racocetra persica]
LDWLPICQSLGSLEFINSKSLVPNVLDLLRLEPLTILRSITSSIGRNFRIINFSQSPKILFGWPENCRQEGYAQVLNSISMNCPNLARLGVMIGPNTIGELFGILTNCKKLKTYIYGNGIYFDVTRD